MSIMEEYNGLKSSIEDAYKKSAVTSILDSIPLLVNNSVTAENAKINKNRTTVTKEEREALTIDDLLMFMEGKAKNEISVLRINDDFTSAGLIR
jgi:hypothetical protein